MTIFEGNKKDMKTSEKSNIAIFIILMLMTFPAFAQSNVVIGKVTTFKTIAVINAKITVKKSKKETFTDSLGNFKLECNDKDKLIVKATGFKSKTFKVKNSKDSLKINLVINREESDIDLAYRTGHLRKENVMQAKTLYNTKEPYSFGYNNMIDLLRGKFPNADVTDKRIIVRGNNTSSAVTSNGALIVLNGVTINIGTLLSVNIREIKNIRILHGAAATRFGSGSSNGVISVELLKK